MKMSSRDYDNYKDLISNWRGDKNGLQRVYDEIFHRYDDGREMLQRLDTYQRNWTMDLH